MQRENKNQLFGTDKIMNCKFDISYLGWCLFCFNMKGGGCRINIPGKAWFHLATGVFPIRYKKADVDGLVLSDGDKCRGWKKSVRIFYLRYF